MDPSHNDVDSPEIDPSPYDVPYQKMDPCSNDVTCQFSGHTHAYEGTTSCYPLLDRCTMRQEVIRMFKTGLWEACKV